MAGHEERRVGEAEKARSEAERREGGLGVGEQAGETPLARDIEGPGRRSVEPEGEGKTGGRKGSGA